VATARRFGGHLRAHGVAYVALFFAISGSAAAVESIDGRQGNQGAEVLANSGVAVDPGDQATILRSNAIKLVGRCTGDSADVRIGPIQPDRGETRLLVSYATSKTLGFDRKTSEDLEKIGSSPPGDLGTFNALVTRGIRGSLDGSFIVYGGRGSQCTFEASAIVGS
jgi:hypothetical protein